MKQLSSQLTVPCMGDLFFAAPTFNSPTRQKFNVQWLGYNVAYEFGMQIMREAMVNVETSGPTLLLLEHEDVITVTRQHKTTNLLTSKEALAKDNIRLIETDRGGDITFHGQGQLIGYPILKLPPCKGPLDYVRSLESALKKACHELGVQNLVCVPGKTGVWVKETQTEKLKKLIAIGVGISKGVTRHGFAFNITTNLERFTNHIVPCGLVGFGVTSLEQELLGKNLPSLETIRELIVYYLSANLL